MNGFIKMSVYAGMREDLVQAGGGNSAFKYAPDKMVIKASGCQLSEVTDKSGYAIVNPLIIKDFFLNCNNIDKLTEKESKDILSKAFIEGGKPSIETFLHSISGMYSLHTHPVAVNVLTCRKNGAEVLKQLFENILIVPYATPGIELAKAYFKFYREYKTVHDSEPEYTFLMNHGLLVSSDSADSTIEKTEAAVNKIWKYLNIDPRLFHISSELLKLYDSGIIWRVTDVNVLDSYRKIGRLWDHCFCPDCVVFIGRKIYEITSDNINKQDFINFSEKYGTPVVIAYKQNLYIHAESVKKAMEIQSVLGFSAQVMSMNVLEECTVLSDNERNFLLNWDAEKYRKSVK